MKKTQSSKPLLFAIAALVLAVVTAMVITPLPVRAGGEPIVVIVNVANPVDNLAMGDLKKIVLSERSRWDTGKAVAPVMVTAGAPERTAFLKIVCGMNDADFGKYFMQAAFAYRQQVGGLLGDGRRAGREEHGRGFAKCDRLCEGGGLPRRWQ